MDSEKNQDMEEFLKIIYQVQVATNNLILGKDGLYSDECISMMTGEGVYDDVIKRKVILMGVLLPYIVKAIKTRHLSHKLSLLFVITEKWLEKIPEGDEVSSSIYSCDNSNIWFWNI